jgi:hypothetical protein
MPAIGLVIAEERADAFVNGVTTWSRTEAFPQLAVIVVPETTVV